MLLQAHVASVCLMPEPQADAIWLWPFLVYDWSLHAQDGAAHTTMMQTLCSGVACSCAKSCGKLAAACLQLGLVPTAEPAPAYAQQGHAGRRLWAMASALPKAWSDNIVALLPGLHALAHGPFLADAGHIRTMFARIAALDAVQASLQVDNTHTYHFISAPAKVAYSAQPF